MCFSEQVSFTAAAVLTGMGIICFRQVKDSPRYYAIALIPFFFAIQQASEGFQWLYLKQIWGSRAIDEQARSIYLMFAYAFWPFWIPFSLLLPETNLERKKVISGFVLIGLAICIYNGWQLWVQTMDAIATENSIQYTTVAPKTQLFAYVTAVCAPWFFSSLRYGKALGLAYLISVPIASYFYYEHFVSIWCFFAAVITVGIYITLRNRDVRA